MSRVPWISNREWGKKRLLITATSVGKKHDWNSSVGGGETSFLGHTHTHTHVPLSGTIGGRDADGLLAAAVLFFAVRTKRRARLSAAADVHAVMLKGRIDAVGVGPGVRAYRTSTNEWLFTRHDGRRKGKSEGDTAVRLCRRNVSARALRLPPQCGTTIIGAQREGNNKIRHGRDGSYKVAGGGPTMVTGRSRWTRRPANGAQPPPPLIIKIAKKYIFWNFPAPIQPSLTGRSFRSNHFVGSSCGKNQIIS